MVPRNTLGRANPPSGIWKGGSLNAAGLIVLLLDDSVFIRRVLGDLLEKQENVQQVLRARNATEGILMFESRRPDVVILDLELPDDHGLKVLKSIKKARPSCVVLVFSSLSLRDECLAAGADCFMSKDQSVARVPQMLNALCDAKGLRTPNLDGAPKPATSSRDLT